MTATLRPPRFGFVKIVVDDLARIERFYADVFAMERTGTFATDGIEEVILRGAGGLSLVLYHWKDRRPLKHGNAYGPIGFYVEDVDQCFAYALEAGATAVRSPAQYGETIRAAFIADPEGHAIELVSRT